MNDDQRVENLLGAFVVAIADRLREETEAEIGHTGAAASALLAIAQFPDRTIEFLRRAIGLSHPAAVRVVDRLVNERLVRRRTAGRGPAVSLTATAAGKRKARAILGIRRRALTDSLPELARAERETLASVLEKSLAHLADSPGTTICRLCDLGGCRNLDCPVVRRQTELGAPPPEPSPLGTT